MSRNGEAQAAWPKWRVIPQTFSEDDRLPSLRTIPEGAILQPPRTDHRTIAGTEPLPLLTQYHHRGHYTLTQNDVEYFRNRLEATEGQLENILTQESEEQEAPSEHPQSLRDRQIEQLEKEL